MQSAFRLASQRRLSLLAPSLIFATLLVACVWAVSALSAPSLSFEIASLLPQRGTFSMLGAPGQILR